LNEIFPAGEGRDLVLSNCTNCHSIAVIVRGRERGRWERTSKDHRTRVIALRDEEFTTLYEYLIATFTPDKPIPELPQALLNAWPLY
jgi:hypothetical protein